MYIGSIFPLADAWGMHGDIGAGWWIVMVIAMVLFWGVVILVGARLLRGAYDGWPRARHESPLDILERRFAEGASSVEDYRERRAILANRAPAAEQATDRADRPTAETQAAAGTHDRSER